VTDTVILRRDQLKKGNEKSRRERRDRESRLLLVALSLQQLALLVLSHLLATLLDHATQRVSPLHRVVSPTSRARQGVETRSEHVKQLRESNGTTPNAIGFPSGDAFDSTSDEWADDQVSRSPQHPIHGMSAGEEGQNGLFPFSQLTDRALDRRVPGIDHLAAAQVSQCVGSESKFEVDECDIQVEIGVEEFLLRSGFTQRPRFFEVALDPSDCDTQRRSKLGMLGRKISGPTKA
jgi:hypothetical protein